MSSLFLCVSYILTNNFIFYLGSICLEGMRKGGVDGDNQNRPKQCQMHHLGSRCILYPSLFLTLIDVFTLYLGSTDKIQVRMKKKPAMIKMGPRYPFFFD